MTTQTGNPPPPVVVPTRQGSVPLTVRLCSKAQKQRAAFHFEFGDGTHAEAKANTKESICSIADLKCDDSGYYDACVSHTYTRIKTYTATVRSASAVVSQQTIIATAPRAKR